ncbi:MAG: hypothetical protein JWQ27_1272 [Ferruginibacter sp.]|nr:hypothetical protein [Ferruginibacter sp.]
MTIALLSTDELWTELSATAPAVEWKRMNSVDEWAAEKAAAHFYLLENASREDFSAIGGPLFIHSVLTPLKDLNAGNAVRINGWATFLNNSAWEICGALNDESGAVLKELGKTTIGVPDQPGMISPRIISMIINEAFFALEEKVSTEDEIDLAMKLGTNYPHGPFEWSRRIGEEKIYQLLAKLSVADSRFLPASSLKTKIRG